MDEERSISLKVVAEVAAHEDTAIEELQPPIHSAIDTDALDSLFRSTNADGSHPSVEFTYKGYQIQVDGPNEITVSDPSPNFEVTKEVV